jgi:16S rRNA processing protein RimM
VSDLICVGVIAGARGIKGELRIKAFTADIEDLFSYGPLFNEDGSETFKGRVTGSAKGQVIVRIKGVDDRTKADTFKGTKLYIPRSALPEPEEDEFYYSDLEGLKAELLNGDALGTVRFVLEAGAGPSLEIDTPDGEVLVPFTKAAVPVVDIAAGKVVIDPPDGLMEPPEKDGTQDERD